MWDAEYALRPGSRNLQVLVKSGEVRKLREVVYLCKSLLGGSCAGVRIDDCPARLPGMLAAFTVQDMEDTGYVPAHQ